MIPRTEDNDNGRESSARLCSQIAERVVTACDVTNAAITAAELAFGNTKPLVTVAARSSVLLLRLVAVRLAREKG